MDRGALQAYLGASTHIDAGHPAVAATARRLAAGAHSEADIVRACFVFVRNQIAHSADFRRNPVTCRASSVLRHGTGFCYAKSHCWRPCSGPTASRRACATSAWPPAIPPRRIACTG
ncbi:transglutaminase-like domain-containing protein [Massilia varians]|nr:transglutaminase family protein [Massilia varians]